MPDRSPTERSPSERDRPTGREALRGALADWPRHGAALVVALSAVAVALLVDTPSARYGAGLIVFSVWMAWFVLTAIAFVERARF
ncbi:hypothetical protein N0B31_17810 [Salinirubellus salinus]|uniref:Uncharacterized protein n=1 Tax=Salinirubellus salinus TaxID=1364945 RepID=A0A9E7R1L6_9EURY|nr:hypothetical protein [Salinirubellus salinus]UWM53967.1 hypothetical protein N0B31_17810 [Salinirubellus salinus]